MYPISQDRPATNHLPQQQQGLPPSYPMDHVLPPAVPPSREPQPLSTTYNGRIYSLEVVQQPVRARMCGFGDKDRRPITPPPCVRLKVLDANTRQEVDVNEIDISFFVLTVDLWTASGDEQANLVRHSATSPSISTAHTSAYPPPPQSQSPAYPPHAYPAHPHPSMYHPQHQPAGYPPAYYPPPAPGYPPQPPPPQAMPYTPQPQYYHPSYMPPGPPGQPIAPQPVVASNVPSGSGGMYTRNLIGSLSASAFRLSDPNNKQGIWFILQDLSVRTEGYFRLRMNFVDVGTKSEPSETGDSGATTNGSSVVNHGSAPVLATVYSDVFEVFSAKKFPGVIESTSLSKCFAMQGIKIPIRKDGAKGPRGGPPAMRVRGQEDSEDWDEPPL